MMRKRAVGSVTCLHTDDAYASNRTLGAALGKPLDHGVVTDVRGRVVDAAERRVVASYETHAAVWVVGVVGRGSVCLISMSP